MTERRSLFNFHIPYDTSCEKIRKIPEMVERIVKSHTGIRFDRAHLKQFGEYAFEFEVVYFILEPDFNLYMDLQQSINFKIIAEFEKERIYFAYPKPPLVGSMLHNFARPSK